MINQTYDTKTKVYTYSLQCFDGFRTDMNLPKHFKPVSNEPEDSMYGMKDSNFKIATPRWRDIGSNWQGITQPINAGEMSIKGMPSWRDKLALWFIKITRARNVHVVDIAPAMEVKETRYGDLNPMEMFTFARNSLEEAGKYIDRMKIMEDMIQKAKENGQTSRVELLTKAYSTVSYESMLKAAGIGNFLTENSLVEFAVKCQKGLRLDWIANFTKTIPDNVIEIKKKADALKVFDNYVILHYDPLEKAFAKTEAEVREEEAKKRDPILFGVIQGVRKLYFVADWIAPDDALTMEEIKKVLGREADMISNDPSDEF